MLLFSIEIDDGSRMAISNLLEFKFSAMKELLLLLEQMLFED